MDLKGILCVVSSDAEIHFKLDFVYSLPKHAQPMLNILFAGPSQALIFPSPTG